MTTQALHTFAAIEEARRQTILKDLSPTEMTMIAGFSIHWRDRQPLTILGAMRMFDQLSSSTVHRHLKRLRAQGAIDVTPDTVDSRIKYVIPTPALLTALKTITSAAAQPVAA